MVDRPELRRRRPHPAVERPRATRGQVVFRRVMAVLLLALVVLGGWWAATSAMDVAASGLGGGGGGDEPAAAPETTVPVTTAPAPKPLKIVFPEGFTREQMAQRIAAVNRIAKQKRKVTPRLSKERYLALTKSHALPGEFAKDGKARHLEGFLFPALYEFTAKTTTQQLVDKQLDAFRRNWQKVDLSYAQSKNLTAYDVLTIASMIEWEATAPQERKLVSAVIYNRLRVGMPLGIDATIRYGLGVPGTESLRQSHLESDNPYNTRKHLGLPPTPIGNPGLASMQAAAHPASVDYLYYVRKPGTDEHFFTASESEFYSKLCEYGYGCG